MFFLSGCLGAIDNVSDDDFDLIELPDGWGDHAAVDRSPHLIGHATCADLEDALKQSFEQEMRVQLQPSRSSTSTAGADGRRHRHGR